MDQLSCSRGGIPSCTGRAFGVPFQSGCRQRKACRQRPIGTRCDAAWTEVVASGLYTVSSNIQNASNVLATVSPSFLQPTVNTLGSDLARTVALHPSWQGLARLTVRTALQCMPCIFDTLPASEPCCLCASSSTSGPWQHTVVWLMLPSHQRRIDVSTGAGHLVFLWD